MVYLFKATYYCWLMYLQTFEICLEIHELHPDRFLTAPELVWQADLNKATLKLDLLADINMLLMVEKGIRGGVCHALYRYVKANNTYMKNYDKNKELSYLDYWDVNILYGLAMSQKSHGNDYGKL